jgi:hypothetical protein
MGIDVPLEEIKTTWGGVKITYDLNALIPMCKMFNLDAVSEQDRNISPILIGWVPYSYKNSPRLYVYFFKAGDGQEKGKIETPIAP